MLRIHVNYIMYNNANALIVPRIRSHNPNDYKYEQIETVIGASKHATSFGEDLNQFI